jgi:D-alanyl-D-alanine carboxypeptidase
MEHGPDEHPEIPLIRRASLYLDEQTVADPVEPEEGEAEVSKAQAASTRRPVSKGSTNRPVTKHRGYRYISTPPPPAHHTRQHIRPKRSLRDQLVHLRHNQPLIIISSILVVVLIIGAIIANISQSHQAQGSLASNGTPGSQHYGSIPTGIQSAGNPHELVITPQDTDHPPPPVYATAAYLLDADTGATLYARNPFMHLPMMSTTKLMTAVLAVEQGKPDQQITITPAMEHDISQLSAGSTLFGLKQGETYTLRELLYGLLLLSGNDAAVAIGDAIGGNLPHFVAEMNSRAHQLGLVDTHYMNPHGLSEAGHYSSARDLAVLGEYSLRIPLIHQISGTETYIIPQTAGHPEHDLLNGNQFLWWYPGVDAGKTGYDGGSNFVQVISDTQNHHHLLGVTIHTNNWWTDMRDLMNWGFDNFKWMSPRDLDSQQNPIPFDSAWNYFASDKQENTITTADHGRYYIYTGFTVSGPILAYYDKSGGLKKFGYPIGMETVSGTSVESQRFQHATIQCDLNTKQCTTR